jgi:hypothetical protein
VLRNNCAVTRNPPDKARNPDKKIKRLPKKAGHQGGEIIAEMDTDAM